MNKFLSMLLALLGCGCSEKTTTNVLVTPSLISNTTQVEYRYGDSSLPPDYHRSYTIVITAEKMNISIDSYGKVLLTKEYPNNAANFQTLLGSLAQKGIKKHQDKKESEACTGGTSIGMVPPISTATSTIATARTGHSPCHTERRNSSSHRFQKTSTYSLKAPCRIIDRNPSSGESGSLPLHTIKGCATAHPFYYVLFPLIRRTGNGYQQSWLSAATRS